jgi:hypothetical protein
VGQDLHGAGPDYPFTPHYNAADLTFIVESQDPLVLIANLASSIASLGLEQSVVQSLMAKLDAAYSSLQRGNTNATCGQLGAAVNFVNAQSEKKLPPDAAGMILSSLQKIREKLPSSVLPPPIRERVRAARPTHTLFEFGERMREPLPFCGSGPTGSGGKSSFHRWE